MDNRLCEGPNFAILVNGAPIEYYHSIVGFRQGCPLSPYLFILYVDTLSHALRATIQESTLEYYWLAPGAQLLSYILFIDDCHLINQDSFQNVAYFAIIVKKYCHVSVQLVNL